MTTIMPQAPEVVPTPAEIAAALERIPAATVLAWIERIAERTRWTPQLIELAEIVRARQEGGRHA